MDLTLFSNSLWVAISAILVLLMNFGLAFFYSGLVSGRNALNTIKMSIITLGVVPILWWAIGYSLVFTGDGAFFGSYHLAFLSSVKTTDVFTGTKVLTLAFICFQAMFASISPAIISGSGVERFKFRTYLIFISIWVLAVYCPLAHTFWNSNGWASKFGAFDFAGGVVVHVSAGFSGLALAMVLGLRKSGSDNHGKHNLPMMVLGCGLLWFGWFGFNAGSALEVSQIAIQALANTMFATSSAMVVWLIYDFIIGKPRTVTGMCNALVIGLVAITPAAGYVTISSAIAIGAIASLISHIVAIFYNRIKDKLDDALDVFTCHGIPGFLGGILVGVFASHDVNSAIPSGAIYGNWDLLYKQVVVTCLSAAFCFFATYGVLLILRHTIGLRVDEEGEQGGMDILEHGEKAYSM